MLTFADIFEAHADAMPNVVAIAHGEREIDWATFDDGSARVASAYAAAGLGPGSKVGMFMYNCPEYLNFGTSSTIPTVKRSCSTRVSGIASDR